MSTAAMLGIVAALGVSNALAAQDSAQPEPVSSVTIAVGPPTTSPEAVAITATSADAVAVPELSNQPIQLTAAPVITAPPAPAPAPTQPAPVATTNGSR